jgi:hypothetical protein
MKAGGPPEKCRLAGRQEWYRKYEVQCDFCSKIAIERWRKHNLCEDHLNRPMHEARLRDGTRVIEAVDSATVSYKSLGGFYQEASATLG